MSCVSLGLNTSALADKFIIFETSKTKIDFKFRGSWRWSFTEKFKAMNDDHPYFEYRIMLSSLIR